MAIQISAPLMLLAFVLAVPAASQTPFRQCGENAPPEAGPVSGAADVDGDGDLDLVGPGTLLFNDGNAVFSLPPSGVTAPAAGPHASSVALGDLDGDGDVDALDDVQGQVWLNDGSGNFAPSPVPPLPLPPLPVGGLRGHSPILGDVEGDGDLDVFMLTSFQAYHGRAAGPPVLWLNNGLGVFTDASTQVPATAPVYGRWPSLVEFFDFDLDGDVDIFAADLGGRRLLVNDGTGVFTMGPTLAAGATRILGGGIADVDGNGRPDLVFSGGLGDEIWINTASGWQPLYSPPVGLAAQGYLGLDVDGDGDDEVVRLDYRGPSLHDFLPGAGLGPPIHRCTGAAGLPDSRGIAADLDGDGDEDLVLGITGRHRVFLNTRSGTLVEAYGDWSSELLVSGLAGDVEGDGDLDLIGLRSDGAGNLMLWPLLNDGFGDFSPAAIGGGILPDHVAPHLVDIDGDGDLDIYAASTIYNTSANGPVDRLLINADAGWMLHPINIPGTGETFTIKHGDLDGDGDQDIVLARRSPAATAIPPLASLVVRNLGGLNFAPPVPLGPAFQSFDLALGDVDADGDLDVLEANDLWGGFAGTCLLHRNDGTGSFTVDANFPGMAARAVALADLDGDGDLDAMQGHAVYVNDGTGTFTSFATISIAFPWEPMGRMSLADTDLDGDLDIIDLLGRYMTNLGNGSFSASTQIPSGGALLSWNSTLPPFPLADFDADGDPDLVAVGQLFHNVTRHLARRGLAGPGRTVYLDLWGPASEPYHLFAAAGPGNTPAPPLGTAWLDLATVVLVTSGTLDSAGTATLPLAVPPNHALIGTALYWQAAVGTSPALTDRIVTAALKL